MPDRRPLPFDPIEEARRNWVRAGWEPEAAGMALVTSVMRAQQILLARVDRCLAPFGLTFARFEVLMLLRFTRTGAMPLGKIGHRLQVHAASVTNAINRLAADGFVERRPHERDGRTTLAVLTPAGRRVVDSAAAALNTHVFGDVGLDEDDAHAATRALTALRRRAGDFE